MTSCTRCQTAIEDGDLRCSICAFPVPGAARPVDGPLHAQVLRCGDCGAAVAFSAEARAPRCGFCGATMAIEQPVDPIETARKRVPFAEPREAAEAALRSWLSRRGWFAPPALSNEAVLESLTPLSWAAWLVNADALVTWTADSDADARRSSWAPHAGETHLAFHNIIVPASRGLRATECRKLIPYYDLGRAVPVEAAAKVRVEPQIPGRRFLNVHVACLLERQTTERIALPVWVLAYRYRGEPYRALIHGQHADIVVGRSPLDMRKVATLVAIALAICALIAFFLLSR